MNVSIIIPTYNRNEILCRTISNILLFEHQYHELIIVDQTKNHDIQTKIFLEDLSKNKRIIYIFVENPNLPNARNVGISNSSGDIILFFDDDIEINEDTIPSHIKGFSQDDIGCVTGKVLILNENRSQNLVLGNSGKIKRNIKSFFFFFFNKRASYVGRLGILSDFSGEKNLPSDTCIGCNMSFRKDVFLKCGNFDTNYSGNAVREDTDMSIRLRNNGYKIIYISDAGIIHYMDNAGGTRTASNDNYWYTFFKNQCFFYLKNFKYSYFYIFFIQFFDLIRCKKSGISSFSLFNKSFEDAKLLVNNNKEQ